MSSKKVFFFIIVVIEIKCFCILHGVYAGAKPIRGSQSVVRVLFFIYLFRTAYAINTLYQFYKSKSSLFFGY